MKKRCAIGIVIVLILVVSFISKSYYINDTSQIDGAVIKSCKRYLWKENICNLWKVDFSKVSQDKLDTTKGMNYVEKNFSKHKCVVLKIGKENYRKILVIDSNTKKVVGYFPTK